MKKLNSTRNLFLYAFLGVLFCAASQVDVNRLAASAMDKQTQRIDAFVINAFGR
ncbi:hypothetical protein [Luteimonas sp. SDU101]|uniref:hypothetical protein n=1 Tax=Luteimonas sp. SDU101 TaxID=3422593 RepID=UPI003EB9F142